MTIDCLERVLVTTWDGALDVVLVDNGSTDGVADEVAHRMPAVDVRRSAVNLGFAGGCNLGLSDLDGIEYVALANNDLLVEPDWLAPLRAALEDDPRRGAACPKMLLSERFVEIALTCRATERQPFDGRRLGVRVSGGRMAGRDGPSIPLQFAEGFFGPEHRDAAEGWFEWTGPEALVRIPVGAPPLSAVPTVSALRLGADQPVTVVARSGDVTTQLQVAPGVEWYEVALGGPPIDVVNNAGTVLRPDGYGADRGYLQADRGQYDSPDDVFAWSGGAVLLRAAYLRDVGLFDERLFLYYEDLELSWRGRKRGWTYAYVPASVVRHHHAATAVSGSDLAEYYKERNRLAVLTRHATPGTALRAAVRYLMSTASYLRRDVVAPALGRRPPNRRTVVRRLRSFVGFLRLAPAMVRARR